MSHGPGSLIYLLVSEGFSPTEAYASVYMLFL